LHNLRLGALLALANERHQLAVMTFAAVGAAESLEIVEPAGASSRRERESGENLVEVIARHA